MQQLDIFLNDKPGTLSMSSCSTASPIAGFREPGRAVRAVPKKLPRKPRLQPREVRGEGVVIQDYMEWAYRAGVRTIHVFKNARACPCAQCASVLVRIARGGREDGHVFNPIRTVIGVDPADIFGPVLPDADEQEQAT